MANDDEMISIAAVGGALASDDGEAVAFGLAQNDGTTQRVFRFACAAQTATDLIAALLQALRQAGANRQARGSTTALGLAPPSFRVAVDSATETVKLTVESPPHAPLELALSRSQAMQLSEHLAVAGRSLG
jgi:hypothetical protein